MGDVEVNDKGVRSLRNEMEIGRSSVQVAGRSRSSVRGGGLISLVGQSGNSIRVPLSSVSTLYVQVPSLKGAICKIRPEFKDVCACNTSLSL